MLRSLPPEDAVFYNEESSVVTKYGKCIALARAIQTRFCFVGGSEDQYISYLGLPEAKPLWEVEPGQ